MIQQILHKYRDLEEKNLIFAYSGLLSMDLLAQLMKLSDTILTSQAVPTKRKKGFINALIESLQNVLYHTDDRQERSSFANDSCILVGRDSGSYFIYTGNYIPNHRIEALENRLTILKTMSVEELKMHYFDTLGKGEISEKGGAGLGLIRIFMESAANTVHSFDPIDENYSFFGLEIHISST